MIIYTRMDGPQPAPTATPGTLADLPDGLYLRHRQGEPACYVSIRAGLEYNATAMHGLPYPGELAGPEET